ncbi:MAG TPA: YhjD/YihY/BrkB family envelope integrity protein [Candidatus Acidoferrum sp.]|nr:YhjD/YihY/BrkB family envelope integrity protein [Candidatus Acidoferrum sp.]
MAKKPSSLSKLREGAQSLLDERALLARTQHSKLHRFAHFWVMVGKSFVRNRCPVRASALAYATILALIPMLAVVVSITSSILKKQGEESIDRFIVKLVVNATSAAARAPGNGGQTPAPAATNAPAMTATNALAASGAAAGQGSTNALPAFAKDDQAVEARHAVAHYIHQFIQNTRSAALGVTGSALLIFVAISMLSRIEDTFNDIWGVACGRSWFMRVVLYWAVISLVPVLLAVALGLATGPHLESTRKLLTTMPFLGRFIMPVVFWLAPIAVLSLTFGLIYILIPNTRVRWDAALVGGLVGGVLFHLNNAVSVLYVSRVVSNSRIYGSLGLVPVFMVGLYLSWLILLFGAQVAYAYQSRAAYFEERQIESINQRGREFVALRLMTCVGQRFVRGEPPPGLVEIAEDLAVPTRLVQQIMDTLRAARLAVETAGAEPTYLPARPLEAITCHDILQAMRATQGQELATRDEPAREEVYGEFHRIEEAERQAAASVTLLALVHRAQGQKVLTG